MMYIFLSLAAGLVLLPYINPQCCQVECIGEFLVSGPNGVLDSALTASSEFDSLHGPDRARLGTQEELPGIGSGSWSPAVLNTDQWIQVDFGSVKRVSGVVTQGRNAGPQNQSTTEYRVLYRENIEPFRAVTKNGNEMFQGNDDLVTPVINMFKSVMARFVRINPTAWEDYIALRFDVIGCEI
ncbi:unnamed protein product [Owenia fusiformis]|uniref:Uncharacterized protein n=1 Tax=Owenia fusiformis TaxID=6347 RepID=A0A8J1TM14_OWEFU|nr:unnamed protein product [Owenia fusiformis]